jgi:eukaryotic-like serine/threonine-protein kinase
MGGKIDRELLWAGSEGVLSPDEAAALRVEAAVSGRSPLELLIIRGRISPEAAERIRCRIAAESDEAQAATISAIGSRSDAPLAVDSQATVPDDSGAATAAAVSAFPIPGWDRYRPIRLLGEGGMGKVFLATDPKLGRRVALKFVRGDNPRHTARLVAEARAQARVNHDRVCKVF